jgi:hypothetical protein
MSATSLDVMLAADLDRRAARMVEEDCPLGLLTWDRGRRDVEGSVSPPGGGRAAGRVPEGVMSAEITVLADVDDADLELARLHHGDIPTTRVTWACFVRRYGNVTRSRRSRSGRTEHGSIWESLPGAILRRGEPASRSRRSARPADCTAFEKS